MKTNFTEILNENKLVIPIIQRDFAQGRTDEKTSKIRSEFLDAIFGILKERTDLESEKSLELDFIYGFNTKLNEEQNSFVPIDGQQRLTTLWLLMWFIASKENIKKENSSSLENFKYETRHSTTVFCEKLVEFKPNLKNVNIAKEIKNQAWFFDTWVYDPSIKAMLVMLQEIELRYKKINNSNLWDLFNHKNNPYTFYKLDMEKVGLEDDLYIKMNSRGKPLTEFEYFKAGFLEIIEDDTLKKRFDESIDKEWSETIWQIVYSKYKGVDDVDIALLADASFMRLINYITDVIAYKSSLTFTTINHSIDETKTIYKKKENLEYLFNLLDKIVELNQRKENFWQSIFYIGKENFEENKTRLFFQNTQINLLDKCLFNYNKAKQAFSLPEQVLLHSCFTHLLENTADFNRTARIVRNLVANSENELRLEKIGKSFTEIEKFVKTNNFNVLDNFNGLQIKDEIVKFNFIKNNTSLKLDIEKLEDSSIFRGSISIFDLNDLLIPRIYKFLDIFDEDIVIKDFTNRANVLMCFGDNFQEDGSLSNMLCHSRRVWRRFFTYPGYNKTQFISHTKKTLLYCLDFFNKNEKISIQEKIDDTLSNYKNNILNWDYYFIKYPELRFGCNQGFYTWAGDNYIFYKMKERQFNGYHWDAILDVIRRKLDSDNLTLNIGLEMQLIKDDSFIVITSNSNGFLFVDKNDASITNNIYDKLINDKLISKEGLLKIQQDSEGFDLQDRVEKCISVLKQII